MGTTLQNLLQIFDSNYCIFMCNKQFVLQYTALLAIHNSSLTHLALALSLSLSLTSV